MQGRGRNARPGNPPSDGGDVPLFSNPMSNQRQARGKHPASQPASPSVRPPATSGPGARPGRLGPSPAARGAMVGPVAVGGDPRRRPGARPGGRRAKPQARAAARQSEAFWERFARLFFVVGCVSAIIAGGVVLHKDDVSIRDELREGKADQDAFLELSAKVDAMIMAQTDIASLVGASTDNLPALSGSLSGIEGTPVETDDGTTMQTPTPSPSPSPTTQQPDDDGFVLEAIEDDAVVNALEAAVHNKYTPGDSTLVDSVNDRFFAVATLLETLMSRIDRFDSSIDAIGAQVESLRAETRSTSETVAALQAGGGSGGGGTNSGGTTNGGTTGGGTTGGGGTPNFDGFFTDDQAVVFQDDMTATSGSSDSATTDAATDDGPLADVPSDDLPISDVPQDDEPSDDSQAGSDTAADDVTTSTTDAPPDDVPNPDDIPPPPANVTGPGPNDDLPPPASNDASAPPPDDGGEGPPPDDLTQPPPANNSSGGGSQPPPPPPPAANETDSAGGGPTDDAPPPPPPSNFSGGPDPDPVSPPPNDTSGPPPDVAPPQDELPPPGENGTAPDGPPPDGGDPPPGEDPALNATASQQPPGNATNFGPPPGNETLAQNGTGDGTLPTDNDLPDPIGGDGGDNGGSGGSISSTVLQNYVTLGLLDEELEKARLTIGNSTAKDLETRLSAFRFEVKSSIAEEVYDATNTANQDSRVDGLLPRVDTNTEKLTSLTTLVNNTFKAQTLTNTDFNSRLTTVEGDSVTLDSQLESLQLEVSTQYNATKALIAASLSGTLSTEDSERVANQFDTVARAISIDSNGDVALRGRSTTAGVLASAVVRAEANATVTGQCTRMISTANSGGRLTACQDGVTLSGAQLSGEVSGGIDLRSNAAAFRMSQGTGLIEVDYDSAIVKAGNEFGSGTALLEGQQLARVRVTGSSGAARLEAGNQKLGVTQGSGLVGDVSGMDLRVNGTAALKGTTAALVSHTGNGLSVSDTTTSLVLNTGTGTAALSVATDGELSLSGVTSRLSAAAGSEFATKATGVEITGRSASNDGSVILSAQGEASVAGSVGKITSLAGSSMVASATGVVVSASNGNGDATLEATSQGQLTVRGSTSTVATSGGSSIMSVSGTGVEIRALGSGAQAVVSGESRATISSSDARLLSTVGHGVTADGSGVYVRASDNGGGTISINSGAGPTSLSGGTATLTGSTSVSVSAPQTSISGTTALSVTGPAVSVAGATTTRISGASTEVMGSTSLTLGLGSPSTGGRRLNPATTSIELSSSGIQASSLSDVGLASTTGNAVVSGDSSAKLSSSGTASVESGTTATLKVTGSSGTSSVTATDGKIEASAFTAILDGSAKSSVKSPVLATVEGGTAQLSISTGSATLRSGVGATSSYVSLADDISTFRAGAAAMNMSTAGFTMSAPNVNLLANQDVVLRGERQTQLQAATGSSVVSVAPGNVTLWSDDRLTIAGTRRARLQFGREGNGSFIEVAGRTSTVAGQQDSYLVAQDGFAVVEGGVAVLKWVQSERQYGIGFLNDDDAGSGGNAGSSGGSGSQPGDPCPCASATPSTTPTLPPSPSATPTQGGGSLTTSSTFRRLRRLFETPEVPAGPVPNSGSDAHLGESHRRRAEVRYGVLDSNLNCVCASPTPTPSRTPAPTPSATSTAGGGSLTTSSSFRRGRRLGAGPEAGLGVFDPARPRSLVGSDMDRTQRLLSGVVKETAVVAGSTGVSIVATYANQSVSAVSHLVSVGSLGLTELLSVVDEDHKIGLLSTSEDGEVYLHSSQGKVNISAHTSTTIMTTGASAILSIAGSGPVELAGAGPVAVTSADSLLLSSTGSSATLSSPTVASLQATESGKATVESDSGQVEIKSASGRVDIHSSGASGGVNIEGKGGAGITIQTPDSAYTGVVEDRFTPGSVIISAGKSSNEGHNAGSVSILAGNADYGEPGNIYISPGTGAGALTTQAYGMIHLARDLTDDDGFSQISTASFKLSSQLQTLPPGECIQVFERNIGSKIGYGWWRSPRTRDVVFVQPLFVAYNPTANKYTSVQVNAYVYQAELIVFNICNVGGYATDSHKGGWLNVLVLRRD